MFARDCKLDVITVSESWLVQSVASSFVALDGYSVANSRGCASDDQKARCLFIY